MNSCHWPAPLMGRFALSQPYSTNNEKGTTVVTISFHIHLRLFLNRKRLILWGLCLTISLRQQKDVLELKTCQTHKKNILIQFVKKNCFKFEWQEINLKYKMFFLKCPNWLIILCILVTASLWATRLCFYMDFALCSDPMKLPLPPKIPAGLSEEGGKKRSNNNHYAINFSNTTALTELSASNLPEDPDSNPTASWWQF